VGIFSLVWTPNSAELLYAVTQVNLGVTYAWRVGIAGDRPPERLELLGSRVSDLAMARSRGRLAFGSFRDDSDICRFIPGRPSEPLLGPSSFPDGVSDFSPDGRRIAFESIRSDGEHTEIWLSNADGSNPHQLTHGPGRYQGSPYWSPDGQRVAFDSQADDGHTDIWVIAAAGGAPGRLTKHSMDETGPSFSRDGSWVYFASNRSGAWDIWRVPSSGGSEERVTTMGADSSGARDSLDGKTLYFTRDRGLYARSLTGGAERKLAECVAGQPTFGIAMDGVYYPACRSGQDPSLHLIDTKTGQDRALGTLEKFDDHRIAVSPDGRTILYSKVVSRVSGLMMIENFH
jgi:Tol biopolymer transport system component